MPHEILTPEEMANADRATIHAGPPDGYGLMRNAGAAVFREALGRFPDATGYDVLCGPGNNGGDGYVVARLLRESGLDVRLFCEGTPRAGSDAARAAGDVPIETSPLADFDPDSRRLAIDALFGAGLARGLDGAAARAAAGCAVAGVPVLAVDLPSGVSGLTGQVATVAFRAAVTVTFARRKPGHLLLPGRSYCGETIVADIGIPDAAIAGTGALCHENVPSAWLASLPLPGEATHKYERGHAAVLSGGASSSGAARLAALAAARAGAGAVTLLSPGEALLANAAHLTAIMLARVDDAGAVETFLAARRVRAVVAGPGFGVGDGLRRMVGVLLRARSLREGGVVLDADALTTFREAPADLFAATGAEGAPPVVMTPHEGEFARLFPDLAAAGGSKLDRAREAAARSAAVMVLKGPDTVIAAPDGRAAINANGSPWLATAGSGDVLAGLIAGLLAQRMRAFEAARAAVWIHAEAASRFGPGLIADDLPGLVPGVLRGLYATAS